MFKKAKKQISALTQLQSQEIGLSKSLAGCNTYVCT